MIDKVLLHAAVDEHSSNQLDIEKRPGIHQSKVGWSGVALKVYERGLSELFDSLADVVC